MNNNLKHINKYAWFSNKKVLDRYSAWKRSKQLMGEAET